MSSLLVQRNAGYWSVALNRPDKLNALSASIVEELIDVVELAVVERIPVLAFSGEGRCFSAGFDMTDVDKQSEGDLLLRFTRIEMLLHRIAGAPFLSVAFAHGRNFGAGVDLIGACKVRIAAPGTTFRMPGLQFGLVLGSARFARIVGKKEARRILEASVTFDSEHALRNEFIDQIVEPGQWEQIAVEQAGRIASLPEESRVLLYQALDDENADADLAALVRSAAKPGLKQRIENYRNAAATAKAVKQAS